MGNFLSQFRYLLALGAVSTTVMVSFPSLVEAAPGPDSRLKQTTEAPATEPEATTESEAAPQPASPATSVSAEELEQFAAVIPELQSIQENAQAEVMAAVEASGLSAERFNQIAEANASADAPTEVDVSSDEQAAFDSVISEIQQIEENFLAQRQDLLETEGLTVERYQQILAAVQEDPALLQQVEALIQG